MTDHRQILQKGNTWWGGKEGAIDLVLSTIEELRSDAAYAQE